MESETRKAKTPNQRKFKPPVTKGGRYTLDITGMGHSGEGVGRVEGFTVFVPYALAGETVEIEAQEVKKQYARGRLKRVIQASADRQEPQCPIYYRCGGCQLQHLTYEGQLQEKKQRVQDALTRIGGLEGVKVKDTLPAEPWGYRNKMMFPVAAGRQGVEIGCYAHSSHRVVDTEDCLIQEEANNRLLRAVREVAGLLGTPAYDEQTGQGILRHVMGRVGAKGEALMAVLVTATPTLPKAERWVAELRQKMPELTTIVHNFNPDRTNVALGRENSTLWGSGLIEEQLDELVFSISPLSFFQVNTRQTERLYGQVGEYAQLSGRETVLDIYCGTGTIALFLARRAGKVYGVEVVEPAVLDARNNASRNGITNAEFFSGDATVWMQRFQKEGIVPDVLVLDPPRAGCDQAVLAAGAAMGPNRLIYVSCNPATLARDAAFLATQGYELREVQPVDMFPQTCHVECVALIERKKIRRMRREFNGNLIGVL